VRCSYTKEIAMLLPPCIRLLVCSGALALAACGGGADRPTVDEGPAEAPLSLAASLGDLIFEDVSLSASGKQSCASCHVNEVGHAADNALAVQLGGPLLDQPGLRSSPSIRYLFANTPFHFDEEGTPTGGFFWDGRAATLQAQAREPLLGASEMANASVAEVVQKLSKAAYADEFKRLFGSDIFSRPDDALAALTIAVQAYQLEDKDFRPFSSKFDLALSGKAELSAQEQRGQALFNDEQKGNCAACHPSAKQPDGSPPLFTDFSYDNLGVPRNAALPRNADPAHFDLGLCARADLSQRPDLCGAFKVPSLRNSALRKVYFHNGRFTTLKEVVTFYVQRDTNPEKWYPRDAGGAVRKFDDLPAQYRENVNTSEAPYTRQPGDAPALSDAEVDDVVAFLRTLTDGYRP
jgi:cytochrome c peroxidase